MDNDGSASVAPCNDASGKKGRKVGRRTAIKAGIAVSSGLVLGSAYQAPAVTSVSIAEAKTVSGGILPPTEPDDEKPGRAVGHDKDGKKDKKNN